MFIEEESNMPSTYQPSTLEYQLIESIMDSFHNHLTANASFLAERLLCEHDTEEFRSLLAECYLKENKPHKVCHLLKDCKNEYSRYQLAVSFLRCGKIKEAERSLVGLMPNSQKIQGQIPNGAYGHYLLAQIYEKQSRSQEAKEHYIQALELNPTLWVAFERLSKLGEPTQGAKIFSEQKQKKYETTRKTSSNILSTITNIMKNRTNSNRLSLSGQKDINEEDENIKRDESDQKPKSLIGRFSMVQSQIVNPQTIQQFSINMEDSLSGTKNNNQLSKSRQSKNPQQQVNFTNYQNLLQQPLTYQQQQGRITAQKKTQQDVQRVGSSALHLNQTAFSSQSIPQAINSISSLLRTLSVPLQLWTLQNSEAIPTFMKLPPNHYKSGWVLERVARCFMDQVKYVEAEKIWKELKELEPNRLEGMDYYSSCLWNLKKQTELTYLAHACLQISHLASETWIALGNCFSLNKENENSLKHFNRAIQLKPDNAYAHTLSGHEYVQIEDFAKAQRCYETAITLDSQQYNAWWGLGNISYKREKYEQAITFFKKAIQVNPRNSVIFCFLGMALAAKGDHQEALKYYQASEQIDPKNGMNKFEKANSLVKMEQFESALQELKNLELMLPREPQIFLLMGKIYKKLNKTHESFKCFSTALSLDNKDTQRIKGMIDSLNNQDNEFNDDFDL